MYAVFIRKSMHKGVVYDKGDKYWCEDKHEKPTWARWEHETDKDLLSKPLPVRGCDTLLILGDAPTMLADVAKLNVPLEREVMAVNRAAFRWQAPVHYWVTVHPNELGEWLVLWNRLGYGGNVKPYCISNRPVTGTDDWALVGNPESGGSITEALESARQLGHKKIFVAGAPLTDNYMRFAKAARVLVSAMRKEGIEVIAASGALAEEG